MYQKRDEWLRILVNLHVGGGQNKYEKVEIHILSMFSSILLFMHTFLLSSREGHKNTKRGYREDNNLDSDDEISPVLESQMIREKRQPGGNITGREGNENNTESDSSDSDDASETTPLLRGSRKTG